MINHLEYKTNSLSEVIFDFGHMLPTRKFRFSTRYSTATFVRKIPGNLRLVHIDTPIQILKIMIRNRG